MTILGRLELGGRYMLFEEHEDWHFDDEWHVHLSSKNDEESGYGIQLGLITNLY